VLVVTDRGRVLRIPIHEVLYLKADQKYVSLRSTQGSWLLDESLSELEQRLGEGFMRVHRNAVVALGAVRALAQGGPDGDDGWQVQLVNGDWLAVSRRLLPAVREVLAGRG
jgi:two-component system response regulator AlgR